MARTKTTQARSNGTKKKKKTNEEILAKASRIDEKVGEIRAKNKAKRKCINKMLLFNGIQKWRRNHNVAQYKEYPEGLDLCPILQRRKFKKGGGVYLQTKKGKAGFETRHVEKIKTLKAKYEKTLGKLNRS